MSDTSLLRRLTAINPNQIRGYLVNNGWVEDGAIGEVASIWHRPVPEEFEYEILNPETRTLRDYGSRVGDLIGVLARFERRQGKDVLNDISRFFADIIKVRVAHEDVEAGTIPLEDGVLLIEKAMDVLASATLATLSKKRYFSGNRPQEVGDFMSAARLGQTEAGSYVVNIIAPIIFPERELVDRASFARLVTTTLAVSLNEVQRLVDNPNLDTDSVAIDQAVEKGVSANLCDSLIGLAGDGKTRDFSISISFSKSEAKRPDIGESFSFTTASIPRLERTSEYLKDNYVIKKNACLFGLVTKLKREANDAIGKVTVTAFIDERERNVTFELPSDEYLQAIHAHENKQMVEYFGDIYISPRSAQLLNGQGFRVIQNGDLFEPRS